MTIRLHIDRLVLHGIDLPRHQFRLLHGAVASELTRLLASNGRDIGRLAGPRQEIRSAAIQIPHAAGGELHVEILGSRIASTVYQSLTRR